MLSVKNLCLLLIKRGRTDGLQDKMDAFLAADRLTVDEYTEIQERLAQGYQEG